MQKSFAWLGLITLLGAAVAAWLLLRPLPAETPVDVDLSAPEANPEPPGDSVRLVVTSIFVSQRSVENYKLLAEYLGRKVGRPFRLIQRKTYGEINELLRRGTVAIGIICAGAYLEAWENGVELEPLARPVNRGRTEFNSVIIVRSDSPCRELEDLRGRSFAFTDPLSLAGHTYPHWILLEKGHDPGTFFKRTVLSYGSEASIRAVRNGLVEAAAVNGVVLEYGISKEPGLRDAVRVVHTSPPLPFGPVVAPVSLDPELRARIAEALLTMSGSEEGRQILANLNLDGFIEPDLRNLDFAAEIRTRVRRYLGPR
ncbi:MAG: phosphate/phosphite/phosphonate ABC transporter substrate-binding protein [Planctomycetes bacterium]|nr:phosphate/phosphite/phosphonate ABC transporter substrate-binding protein [Planctomycetota bacterium]